MNYQVYSKQNSVNIYSLSNSAIYNSSEIINCSFIDNFNAGEGGVVLYSGDIINCSFMNNYADTIDYSFKLKYYDCSIKNCNFINTRNVFFSRDIYNCTFDNSSAYGFTNISSKIINSNFTNGGAIISESNVSIINCSFNGDGNIVLDSREHAYITDCRFFNLNNINIRSSYPHVINSSFVKTGTTIVGYYSSQPDNSNIQIINCSFENCKNRALDIGNGNVLVFNCNFSSNKAGSIIMYHYSDENFVRNIKNCNFVNNFASNSVEGMVDVDVNKVSIINCNFINTSGQVALYASSYGNVSNCSFVNNTGMALLCSYYSNVSNCIFINNKCHNSGHWGYGGAIDCSWSNIRSCVFIGNSADNGGAIRANDLSFIDNCTFKDNYATCHGSAINIPVGNDRVVISNSVFTNNQADIVEPTMGHPIVNVANSAIAKAGLNIDGLEIINCDGLFKNSDKYKQKTKISSAKYDGKYLTVKLVGNIFDNPLSFEISLKINGKTYKDTANKNGIVKFLINVPGGTYTAKVTYNGDNYYLNCTKNVKITIKKATPKLTAKAKTFKIKDKTKKYKVTLKTNKNVAMKNTKITLKVNGKTYVAKTNSKGVATFKITKLTKKGKYTATVTYKGNSYYNKLTKKVKITIK